jgi:hypothetical protein
LLDVSEFVGPTMNTALSGFGVPAEADAAAVVAAAGRVAALTGTAPSWDSAMTDVSVAPASPARE